MNGRIALALTLVAALVAFIPSGGDAATASSPQISLSCTPTVLSGRAASAFVPFTCKVSTGTDWVAAPASFMFECIPIERRVGVNCNFDPQLVQHQPALLCYQNKFSFPVRAGILVYRAPPKLRGLHVKVVASVRECDGVEISKATVRLALKVGCEPVAKKKPGAKKPKKKMKRRQDEQEKPPSAKQAWQKALDPAQVDRTRVARGLADSAADDAFAKAPQLAGELAAAGAWRLFLEALAKPVLNSVIDIATTAAPGLAGHGARGELVGKVVDAVAQAGLEAVYQRDVAAGIKEGVRTSLVLAAKGVFDRHNELPGDRLGKAVDEWVAAALAKHPCTSKTVEAASKELVSRLTKTFDTDVHVDKLLRQGSFIQVSYLGTRDNGFTYRVRASFVHDFGLAGDYVGAGPKIRLSKGEAGYATWWFTISRKSGKIVAYGRPAFTKDPNGFADLEQAHPIDE